MKSSYKVLAASLMLLNLGLWGCKEEKKGPGDETVITPATQPSAAIGEQKVCPVSDYDVDTAVFVEHEGKKVYFCCDGCIETFQKDPARYMAKLPQFGGKEAASKGKMPA